MSFVADVKATSHLQGAFRKGLKAVATIDRERMTVGSRGALLGSVNLDAALQEPQPDAPRWDYLVGQKNGGTECAHWIEVHPASSTANIGEVEAKLVWLAAWMRTTPLAAYPRKIVWIASGKSAFNSRHPKIRALAGRGLSFAGSHLTL